MFSSTSGVQVRGGSCVPLCTICPCRHPAAGRQGLAESACVHMPTHPHVYVPACAPCPVPFAQSQESAFLTVPALLHLCLMPLRSSESPEAIP